MLPGAAPCVPTSGVDYEVKKDFFDKFLSQDKNNKMFFELVNNDKFLFDLRDLSLLKSSLRCLLDYIISKLPLTGIQE